MPGSPKFSLFQVRTILGPPESTTIMSNRPLSNSFSRVRVCIYRPRAQPDASAPTMQGGGVLCTCVIQRPCAVTLPSHVLRGACTMRVCARFPCAPHPASLPPARPNTAFFLARKGGTSALLPCCDQDKRERVALIRFFVRTCAGAV